MLEFLVDTAKVKIGHTKLCKNCKSNIDISVDDMRRNKVVCISCGYTNAMVFFLKKGTHSKF